MDNETIELPAESWADIMSLLATSEPDPDIVALAREPAPWGDSVTRYARKDEAEPLTDP